MGAASYIIFLKNQPLRLTLLTICLGFCCLAQGQSDRSGRWEGLVVQSSGQDTFRYVIDWVRSADGRALYGQATSQSVDGRVGAAFEIAGTWEEGRITFDEVRQLAPAEPLWCRKHVEISLQPDSPYPYQGKWQAEGCRPGLLYLRDAQPGLTNPAPPSVTGHWVGQLVQSDRDDIFYFTLDVAADGTGRSFIISTGEGGEATHILRWSIQGNTLQIDEERVANKTDANWPWCIKSYTLHWEPGNAKDLLSGSWAGYIELKDPTTARCAPGRLTLEKMNPPAVLPLSPLPYHERAYEKAYARTVQVDRILEVASPDIKIRVWDNGTVDGDRVTLILNGERILEDFRVSKRKWGRSIKLLPGENLLVLHAEDLGDISPNTVAVSLDDGVREQIIILNSNLRESGAILMQPFRYEGGKR